MLGFKIYQNLYDMDFIQTSIIHDNTYTKYCHYEVSLEKLQEWRKIWYGTKYYIKSTKEWGPIMDTSNSTYNFSCWARLGNCLDLIHLIRIWKPCNL